MDYGIYDEICNPEKLQAKGIRHFIAKVSICEAFHAVYRNALTKPVQVISPFYPVSIRFHENLSKEANHIEISPNNQEK